MSGQTALGRAGPQPPAGQPRPEMPSCPGDYCCAVLTRRSSGPSPDQRPRRFPTAIPSEQSTLSRTPWPPQCTPRPAMPWPRCPQQLAGLPRNTVACGRSARWASASYVTSPRTPKPPAPPPIASRGPVDTGSFHDLIDTIAAGGAGLVMTMGKGGVGKTTVAAAVAMALAERGHRVHLTTTDPAAHVADAWAAGQCRGTGRRPDRPGRRDRRLHRGGAGQRRRRPGRRSPCPMPVIPSVLLCASGTAANRRWRPVS